MRQGLVRAGLEVAGEAESLPFIGSMRLGDGVHAVAESIRKALDFDRNCYRDKPDPRSAFAYLRACAENSGIFVILVDNLGSWHTAISVDAFRGFALADDIAPFVAINANDSPGAWSFTLAHELAHLWIGSSGLSGSNADTVIEKFCNDVSGKCLLSFGEAMGLDIIEDTPLEESITQIADFARFRNVSNTMVAYMLYRAGAFSFARFQQLKKAYRDVHLARKEADKSRSAGITGGPSYFSIRKHRVGVPLIRLVDQLLHEGNLSVTKAGMVLGVGAQNVFALLEHGRSTHSF